MTADSHRIDPWSGSFYIYLLLAPVLAFITIYAVTKLINYLEKCQIQRSKRKKRESKKVIGKQAKF